MSKKLKGYLFVHFTDEDDSGEQIYFSISEDGLHWNDLNNGKPVLVSKVGEKGVRDPFIIKAKNENRYYIIATDLRMASGKGWDVAQYEGSRSIVIWETTDLINWSSERLVEVGIPKAGCVWAPEAIYNERTDSYLVFWASMVKEEEDENAKQRIYCSMTKDFYSFSEPLKYIEAQNHIIDTTIVRDGEYYYRISKDETTKNIKMDRCRDLLQGPFEPVVCEALEKITGVEGPAAFKFNDSDRWCLMVDQFATSGGYLPLVTKELSNGEFHTLDKGCYDMGATKKRHGSVLNIDEKEFDLLTKNYFTIDSKQMHVHGDLI